DLRVLAAAPRSPARSAALSPRRGRRLAHRAPGAVDGRDLQDRDVSAWLSVDAGRSDTKRTGVSQSLAWALSPPVCWPRRRLASAKPRRTMARGAEPCEPAGRRLHQGLELRLGQLDLARSQVLPQVGEREGARNRQHRRRAPQQPCQRDLRGGRPVTRGDLRKLRWAATAEREERDEDDPHRGAVIDDLVVLSLREVVVVLD